MKIVFESPTNHSEICGGLAFFIICLFFIAICLPVILFVTHI